jgi:cytochrome c oxidase cbb3-type subunit 3
MTATICRYRSFASLAVAAALAGTLACEREERRFDDSPPSAPAYSTVTLDTLQPGTPARVVHVDNPSERNAYDISEGKRLFENWNCVGCHSRGGGGMGPPLMDAEWIYGGASENIAASIVEGRPNGMPSFRGRVTDHQLWQLTAYVRSLAGLAPKPAKSGRDDNMQVKVDEQRTRPQPPNSSATRTPPTKSTQP